MPTRKKLRLEGYDYSSPGYYHIVIVTEKRVKYLGNLRYNEMILSPFGIVLSQVLDNINNYYPNIEVLKYQIMPDHVHILVNLIELTSTNQNISIPDFVSRIKTFSVWEYRKINSDKEVLPTKMWHRSFFDRVLRTNEEAELTFDYIDFNPDRAT